MRASTLKRFLTENKKGQEFDFNSYNEFRSLILLFEGKVITRRIIRKIPGLSNYRIDSVGSFAKISVKYKEVSYTIVYAQNPTLTSEQLDKFNSMYVIGSVERIKQLDVILNDDDRFQSYLEYYKKYEKLNKIVREIKEYETSKRFNNPSHYDIFNQIFNETSELKKRAVLDLVL